MSASMSDLMARLAEQQAIRREASVVGQVGIAVRQTINVTIRKPRWMPQWAYRRLMRTIVIEESWPVIQTRSELDELRSQGV